MEVAAIVRNLHAFRVIANVQHLCAGQVPGHAVLETVLRHGMAWLPR